MDSDPVNALSDWAFRVYTNLIAKVDDAGRIDARPRMLMSTIFPAGTTRTVDQLSEAVGEIVDQKLAVRYDFESKAFLQLTKWQRAGNAENSRCPWSDGSYKIAYTTRGTRDGEKQFVATSLINGVGMASTPHDDGKGSDSLRIRMRDTDAKTKTDVCTMPAAAGKLPPANGKAISAEAESALLIFPTVPGKRGGITKWELTTTFVKELREGFPGLDVMEESRRALIWVKSKPANRKTASGMREFLFKWMTRSHNSGAARRGNRNDAESQSDTGFAWTPPSDAEVNEILPGGDQ